MEILTSILSAFGLSASAGLNAYIPLLVIALLARFTDMIKLASPWDTLTNGWVIGVLVILAIVESLADKFPAINHINDIIQSFVRPTAGAIVFAASAQVITEIHPVVSLTAGLLVAGGVHGVKALLVRPMVTATTGGAGNVPVSLMEEFTATSVSIMAIIVPVILSVLIFLLAIWLTWLLWRRSRGSQYGSVA
jgi:hypothetical protein